jgi:hypothetical protein
MITPTVGNRAIPHQKYLQRALPLCQVNAAHTTHAEGVIAA